jgi:hypothetical protein
MPTSSPRRRACACLSILLTLLVSSFTASPAGAQPKDGGRAEARRLLRAGNAAYKRGDFSAALARFEEAAATFPSARIQFNIGQAQRELGHPVEAVQAFESFLAEADRITTLERKQATTALEDLEPAIARLSVATTPPDATVTVDGSVRGTTPLPRPLVLAPGNHEIAIALTGFVPARENITVAGGEARRLSVELALAPVAAAPAQPAAPAGPTPGSTTPGTTPPGTTTPPEPLPTPRVPEAHPGPPATAPAPDLSATHAPMPALRTEKLVGVTLIAASTLFAVGGSLLLASSWSRFHDAQDRGCAGDCDDVADSVDTRTLWSKLLFGAAVASGVGGGVLLLTSPPAMPLGAKQIANPRGLMVGTHGRF